VKQFFVLFLLLVPVQFATPLFAADDSGTGFLPAAHELFRPLLADPRELQYALRYSVPVSQKAVGKAAMGDYLGIYRWKLPWEAAYLQFSIGGGVFGRFDLAGTSNNFESVDFYANVPFDLRFGKWSVRLMPYHTSSHLGDDLLKDTGQTTTKHSWDNMRSLLSYDLNSWSRLYGGYTYAFQTHPGGLGRQSWQAGLETYSGWWCQQHAQTYWANDFQSWQRIQWNPIFNSQLGIKWVRTPQNNRGISTFIEFSAGHQPEGQFYLQRETVWTLGLKFDLS
jgi:hypothetical protein